ncbi:uncharacterized protein LOC142324546 [Lycorma delicatula]|uniref:uncharacterized protein LOC142324546 n=1 Tax=Lycorma delicatula TaxID=130591 RepID=UPI003F515093
MQHRILIRTLICFIVIFVEILGGSWNHIQSSTAALETEQLSQYTVDALQIVTSCITPRNFRRPLRFGRCILSQFSNSDLKANLIYPKLKEFIRTVLNRTIAGEHTYRYKLINKFINSQLSNWGRYGTYNRGYGASEYGNSFADNLNSVTTVNRYEAYGDDTYP